MTDLVRLEDPNLTLVPGYRAAGVACGLKKAGGLDMALVCADVPCMAAAVFTTNQVKAAPVLYDQALIDAGRLVQAVLINSGGANACTGRQGLEDAHSSARLVGQALGIPAEGVFVMSTGVIGQHLPMDRIAAGILKASRGLSTDGGHAAARAIMTTDTRPKEAAVRLRIRDQPITIAGMCKGAGMIHPNMATMLALMVTDAAVDQDVLHSALRATVDRTFNMISVDGDMSTNDTLLLLSSGRAMSGSISRVGSDEYRALVDGLTAVATDLAQSIVRDGEGASKFITIQVTGGPTDGAATRVAKSIANSSLVKTAVYGQDANWGRVLCAAGYSGVSLDPDKLSLWMENQADTLHLVRGGEPYQIDEARAAAILRGDEVTWRLDLGLGASQATVWTCDLTHAYVDINAHYRT
jgi:glutamate N-acetyltransferase / amino-acid N-acetyltransferase